MTGWPARRLRWAALLIGAIVLVAVGLGLGGGAGPTLSSASASAAESAARLPAIKHVFVIMLENEDYAATFGNPSADPYLARTLPAEGALLENYYATGHESNDNYISIISGQPPNPQNQADCQVFDNFVGVDTGSGVTQPTAAGTGTSGPSTLPSATDTATNPVSSLPSVTGTLTNPVSTLTNAAGTVTSVAGTLTNVAKSPISGAGTVTNGLATLTAARSALRRNNSTPSGGVETGTGCVYPATVQNIGTQLTATGHSWKAYEQDMGNDPNRETAACGHPTVNSQDGTQNAEAGDGYATRHDPFVYFHSVIDSQTYCDDHVVSLGTATGQMPNASLQGETGLATDLKHAASTPAFSFITPNLCADGHDYPCKNQTGGASALDDIDSFLSTWVPKITSSAAYKEGGLIEITFDESDGAQSDSSACCGETPDLTSPLPGITGPGGGKVGALLISPFIKPGTTTTTDYNHYSSLASWESLFGLPRLGEAQTVTSTFGSDVFTRTAQRQRKH